MPDQFITTSMILQDSLIELKNNLQFARYVNREYSSEFARAGAKVGNTINLRKPPKYMGRTGNALAPESIIETPYAVTLDTLFGVDLEFTDVDLTTTMDRFKKRYLTNATNRIANEVDRTGLALYNRIYQRVGTPGTVPASSQVYLDAGVALSNSGAPKRGRHSRTTVVGSQMEATLVNTLQGLFQSSEKIRQQYEDGEMGYALGTQFSMDQNIATHTVGPLGGTPLVNGASQTGTSLITDGWTAAAASRVLEGDTFTIAGVFSIRPQTAATGGGVSTGVLQRFVCRADGSSDASGNLTLTIEPEIIGPGSAFQTVNALPADNAALTFSGAADTVSPQGIMFHPDAFVFVSADLEMPRGVDMAGRIVDEDLGISLRLVRAYDIRTNTRPTRLEMLWGWGIPYPELACRIQS